MPLRWFNVAAAFAIALAVLSQGLTAPFEKDAEPQSAQWVVDIVQHDHWLLPYDYYGFVERKPPLFYWLAALVVESSGGVVDEARARSVSLVAGAALAAVVMGWCAAQIGVAQGWLAFVFLLGTYGFASRAVTALTDMLMSFLLFALYCVIYPALDDAQPSRRRTVLAGVLLGLAMLTKGPVTIVIVALAVAIFALLTRRNPLALASRPWPWITLALAILIAAIWYVPAFIAGRSSGVADVFVDENLGHFLPGSLGGTGEAARPVYYIVLRLIGGSLPLSLLIPAAAAAFAYGGFAAQSRKPLTFQLALVLAVVALFSVASSKRDDYILPATPSLAILLAALFASVPASTEGREGCSGVIRAATTALIAAVMLAVTIGSFVFFRRNGSLGALGIRLQSSDASYAAIFADGTTKLALPFLLFASAVLVGSAMIFVSLWRRRVLMTGAGLAILGLAGSILWNGTLRPAEARTRSLGPFAADVRMRVGTAPVYLAFYDPEFAWYWGSRVPVLPKQVAQQGPTFEPGIYLVARPPELRRLSARVRSNLEAIADSGVQGGGGPPRLYLMRPLRPTGVDLNRPPGSVK
ncbi:MAG TPA: glycosyltransferase family 39 protein [Candidatus Binataceae bacterium]|nr:glycosyltransferase family 39 protein [Candidatus Binataceae bacterium]